MNAVVILFITDVDELCYDIMIVINPHWVESMLLEEPEPEESKEDEEDEEDEPHQIVEIHNQSRGNHKLEGEVQTLKKEVQILSQNMELLLEHSPELKKLLSIPQDDQDIKGNPSLGSLC